MTRSRPQEARPERADGEHLKLAMLSMLIATVGCEAMPEYGQKPDSLAASDLAACTLDEVARAGADLGLSDVTSLAVDSRGHVFLAETMSRPGIVEISPAGRPIRSLGREGEGPGEFRSPQVVQVFSREDSLLVYDKGLHRITVFGPRGSVAYTLDTPPTLPTPRKVWKLSDGRYLAVVQRYVRASDDPSVAHERPKAVTILGRDGNVEEDSLLVVPAGKRYVSTHQGAVVYSKEFPFGARALIRLGPSDRIYHARGDSMAVEVYSLNGRRVSRFRFNHDRAEITEADVADVAPSSGPLEQPFREAVPARWPAFNHMAVDDHGNVWLDVITRADHSDVWIAFTPAGDPLCRATAPSELTLRAVENDRAYGLHTTELGVPHVVVYRVRKPPLSTDGNPTSS